MPNIPLRLVGTLSGTAGISGSLSGVGGLVGSLSGAAPITPAYSGPYEYTPTQGTQTVEISGKRATENIVINPIPSNYGLITWDGSVLTVS